MGRSATTGWEFLFPYAFDRALGPSPKRWADARDVLARYFDEQNLGREFERRVQSLDNAAYPDELVQANIDAAQCVHARISNASAREILRTRMPELAEVPEDADALATNAHDAAVVAMVERLARVHGIGVAKATKLLCQKRPALIPMLDSVARPVLGVPDLDEPGEQVRRAYARIREVAADVTNAATLRGLRGWLDAHPPIDTTPARLSLARVSLLRAVDVLAWMKGMEPKGQ